MPATSEPLTTTKEDLATRFDALHEAALAERPPKILKPSTGVRRMLKTIESGKPVTHGQVLQGLLKQAELEIAVQDGKRPKFIKCERCKVPVTVAPIGSLPKRCGPCKVRKCSGCGKKVSRSNETGRCHSCAARMVGAALPPERRHEIAKKANAALTPAQRSEISRNAHAARTSEQRSEIGRKANAALTPAQRSERARKGRATRAAKAQRGAV
jgi:hypothetical protein